MASGTVHLEGWREAMRALDDIKRGTGKAVLGGLAEAAEPVRRSWVSKLSRYRGASTSTLTPGVLRSGIVIRQRKRAVTGKRGDFGALQMRLGLAALAENQDETVRAVEDALDALTRREGF